MTMLVNGSVLAFSVIPDTQTVAACSFQLLQTGTMDDSNFTTTLEAAITQACNASGGNYIYNAGKITVKSGVTAPLVVTRTVSTVPTEYAGYAITVKPTIGTRVFDATSGITHGEPDVEAVPKIRGVNLSGLEFSTGTTTTAALIPSHAQVDVYFDRGFNVIRLPFKKARVQNGIFGDLDIVGNGTGDAERLKAIVDYITINKGMYCILDPHDAASFGGVAGKVGSDTFPVAAFEDFWRKLINYLGKDNNKLIFNIENEPAGLSATNWTKVCNSVTAAIRAIGCTQQIQVPGISFTGAHSWISSGNGVAMLDYTDPINNYVFEVHQYLDSDSSGQKLTCTLYSGTTRMTQFYNWLETNDKKGFLGEIAAPLFDDPEVCPTELSNILDSVNANPRMYGWAAWGGGGYWGAYYNRIEDPATGIDSVVMNLLKSKL